MLGGAQLVFGTVFRVLTVFVLTLYFMVAFDRIKHGAYRLVPASRRERVALLGDEILGKVGAYMVGALAIALLAGVTHVRLPGHPRAWRTRSPWPSWWRSAT